MGKNYDIQKMQRKTFAVLKGMAEMSAGVGFISVKPKDVLQLFAGDSKVYIAEGYGTAKDSAANAVKMVMNDLQNGCDIKQVKGILAFVELGKEDSFAESNEFIERLVENVGKDNLNVVYSLKIDGFRSEWMHIYLVAVW